MHIAHNAKDQDSTLNLTAPINTAVTKAKGILASHKRNGKEPSPQIGIFL